MGGRVTEKKYGPVEFLAGLGADSILVRSLVFCSGHGIVEECIAAIHPGPGEVKRRI